MTLRMRFADFAEFSVNQWESSDVDPVYPVLSALLDASGANDEEAAWLTVHYLTFYNLASALETWLAAGRGPATAPPRPLPCATERRGHRDDRKLLANMRGWVAAARSAGSLTDYLFGRLPSDRGEAWATLRARIEAVPGNGRWASFKYAEIAATVLHVPLQFLDMGHANSSGPRRGLALLWPDAPTGNRPRDVAVLDEYSSRLTRRLRRETGVRFGVEHVETMLCDAYALVRGDYYTGRDIDVMQATLTPAQPHVRDAILAARSAGLPRRYLGEINGWDGPDLARKRAYRDTGRLLTR